MCFISNDYVVRAAQINSGPAYLGLKCWIQVKFRGCANDERQDGIGREPFANAQRFSTRMYSIYVCQVIVIVS